MPEPLPEIRRLAPAPGLQVNAVYEDLDLPAGRRVGTRFRPYVCINMVSSLDGRVAVGGKAGGIGSATDRQTMRLLRSNVDAIMVGAGTLRAEKMSLTSEGLRDPEPFAVVVTGSGDVPLGDNLLDSERDRTIIAVPESMSWSKQADLSRYGRILDVPGNEVTLDLGETLQALQHEFGITRLLAEGGPHLNHALLDAGLVDEIFLSLSPRILGGGSGIPAIVEGHPLTNFNKPGCVTLMSVHAAGDELFLRYRLSK